MEKLYRLLIRVSDGIFLIEKWLLAAAVITAVAVNFVNVILRYLAGGGLAYCEMLSIVLFMFMVIVGGNIAVKTDNEIRIDLLRSKDERKNAAFRLISDVVCIAALCFALKGLADTIASVMRFPQKVTPLPIYTYHIYIVMLIGFVMILLDHVIILLRHLMQMSGKTVEGGARTL